MQPEPDNFSQMLGQLKRLPLADRKSVIARLPLDQRLFLADMMTAKALDRTQISEETNVLAHRYSSLSPQIASICKAVDQGSDFETGKMSRIKPATRQALSVALDEMERRQSVHGEKPKPLSFREMFRDFAFGKRGGS